MQVLDQQMDVAGFFGRVAHARERVLMFDYDGTLAPFHLRPHLAYPYPEVARALDRLMRDQATRVVIVSGRRAEEIMPLLRLERQPEIWGAHGWERLSPEGEFSIRAIDDESLRLLVEAHQLAEGAVEFGARIERKPRSVALHWRGLPTIKVLKTQAWITAAWQPLIHDAGLGLLPFSGGIEAMVRGDHKCHAVRAVLADVPEDSAVAYLGDDFTDEEAFREVRGRGIAVLVREQLRDTHASVWIRPPHELRHFILQWCQAEPA
jgi:trehalose 6-phosphate phosphatase